MKTIETSIEMEWRVERSEGRAAARISAEASPFLHMIRLEPGRRLWI